MHFGRFYLDREKDMIVTLDKRGDRMTYVLSTPNHHTGNLIANLAKLCGLPLSLDENGLRVIRGEVPCYVDAYNERIYIFRLGGTKVANIHPDGRIEMKASVPSVSKTLMSQTKDYRLDIAKTVIKTYVPEDCKFRSDLHTHMNAILSPDILIALGIVHQIRYPLYYIRKLELKCSARQLRQLEKDREKSAARFADPGLTGKYLDRKIDDHTYLNFADLLLGAPKDAAWNIPRIRASLAVLKDGQAVFTNLEKVYLYRYVFTKGKPAERQLPSLDVSRLPDPDIRRIAERMLADRAGETYAGNTLFQDKLLWIARTCRAQGVDYTEISDTALVKRDGAPAALAEIHEVMPKILRETGVTVRFLAGIRRIPLTIVKHRITPGDGLAESLQVLEAVACDPYVAGSDILGEEINDVRELRPVIAGIVRIARDDPSFVLRIHAGENDSLRDNVANSLAAVEDALAPGQRMPRVRIGHGLYTSNLKTPKGRQLLRDLVRRRAVLEFQITSNVRLNNLSRVDQHPLKQYLRAGVRCVQGTDGAGIYGTGSIDEQLTLEKLLELSHDDLLKMRAAERQVIREGLRGFRDKQAALAAMPGSGDVRAFYEQRIRDAAERTGDLLLGGEREDSQTVFRDRIEELPRGLTPVILAGGSFNNDTHRTVMLDSVKRLIDGLLREGDPGRICFVIGHQLQGYERYLYERNGGRFPVYAFVPSTVSPEEKRKILRADVKVRVAIEPSRMGLYKSISYEIFKTRPSVLLALDGNSAGANLIQEARNGRAKCRIFVNGHAKMLKEKAMSLQGYITFLDEKTEPADILRWT